MHAFVLFGKKILPVEFFSDLHCTYLFMLFAVEYFKNASPQAIFMLDSSVLHYYQREMASFLIIMYHVNVPWPALVRCEWLLFFSCKVFMAQD